MILKKCIIAMATIPYGRYLCAYHKTMTDDDVKTMVVHAMKCQVVSSSGGIPDLLQYENQDAHPNGVLQNARSGTRRLPCEGQTKSGETWFMACTVQYDTIRYNVQQHFVCISSVLSGIAGISFSVLSKKIRE